MTAAWWLLGFRWRALRITGKAVRKAASIPEFISGSRFRSRILIYLIWVKLREIRIENNTPRYMCDVRLVDTVAVPAGLLLARARVNGFLPRYISAQGH